MIAFAAIIREHQLCILVAKGCEQATQVPRIFGTQRIDEHDDPRSNGQRLQVTQRAATSGAIAAFGLSEHHRPMIPRDLSCMIGRGIVHDDNGSNAPMRQPLQGKLQCSRAVARN